MEQLATGMSYLLRMRIVYSLKLLIVCLRSWFNKWMLNWIVEQNAYEWHDRLHDSEFVENANWRATLSLLITYYHTSASRHCIHTDWMYMRFRVMPRTLLDSSHSTYSTMPRLISVNIVRFVPIYWFWATVCASTRDNWLYNCALPIRPVPGFYALRALLRQLIR